MDIIIKNIQKKIPIHPKKIKNIILKVLSAERRSGVAGTITVCFITDRMIRQLNRKFHFSDSVTDVLAFDLGDTQDILSDIFVSVDTAVSNAKIFKTTSAYEHQLYVIHGLLHILGYDDHKVKDRAVMRRKEAYYLKKCLI